MSAIPDILDRHLRDVAGCTFEYAGPRAKQAHADREVLLAEVERLWAKVERLQNELKDRALRDYDL